MSETRDDGQSRRCAISLPRSFGGTFSSSIAFAIALCSSGASSIAASFAGVPLDVVDGPAPRSKQLQASAKDTTDFWFLASGRSQHAEGVQGQL
jgi:hypothetical protein